MASRKGRPRKSGARDKRDRLLQAKDYGNDRVQARRDLFHGVRKNAEGKFVDVSDDISDAAGQLHALGFFDAHGHEPDLIRDTMRDYGFAYWSRNADKAPRCGQYERSDRAKDHLNDTGLDLSFERMTRSLDHMRYEQRCLESLVCACWWTDELPGFAKCIIYDKLRQLGRVSSADAPGLNDHEIYSGALRATFRLIETGLQANYRRAA